MAPAIGSSRPDASLGPGARLAPESPGGDDFGTSSITTGNPMGEQKASDGSGARTASPRRGGGARGRSRLPWVILGAVALVAVAALPLWLARPEQVDAVAVARRDVVRTLVLTGRVRPQGRTQLGTSVAGNVREVLVREGARVVAGQLLVRIDDAQAAAGLAQARAALATATSRTRATREQAELVAQSARRDAERARALHAQGAISEKEKEDAERAAANAAAELEAAGARAGGAASATLAEEARARAAVASAEALLALTRVRAPAAGIVLTRSVEPGDAVVPGQLLMELALDGATELVAYAREENLGDLEPEARAIASADAFPDSTFQARLRWVAPVVDPAQGTVEVRFAIPDPPPYLRADMTISVNVEAARREGALVVPRDLVGDISTAVPWVMLERDGRAVRQPVRLGIRGDRDAEVIDGLTEASRVLPVQLQPGRRVRMRAIVGDTSRGLVTPEP